MSLEGAHLEKVSFGNIKLNVPETKYQTHLMP